MRKQYDLMTVPEILLARLQFVPIKLGNFWVTLQGVQNARVQLGLKGRVHAGGA